MVWQAPQPKVSMAIFPRCALPPGTMDSLVTRFPHPDAASSRHPQRNARTTAREHDCCWTWCKLALVEQALVDDLLFLDLKGRVAKRLLQMVTPDLDDLPADGVVVPEVTQAGPENTSLLSPVKK